MCHHRMSVFQGIDIHSYCTRVTDERGKFTEIPNVKIIPPWCVLESCNKSV